MQPSFDTWTSIFLLAVAMGFFLFFVLISSRIKKNYPIAFLVLAFSFILFQYVLYWTRYETIFPYLVLTPPIFYYLTGPLLYMYFLNLYKRKKPALFFLHFVPAIIATIPSLLYWFEIINPFNPSDSWITYVIAYYFNATHMIVYCILLFLLISKNSANNTEYEKVRKTWAKTLFSLYVLFVLSYISYYILVNFSFFNPQWDYAISIMMSLSIYTIGYIIIKQPQIFDGELYANLFLPIKNKNDSFETTLLNELYHNLTNYMNTQKPFLDSELRLVNLADQLGFSTHLLSKVINKKSGANFNNFINDYRLQEAAQLLEQSSTQFVKNIYYDVGFNNKATFYKAFKNRYQCTPSEYRKEKLGSQKPKISSLL